MLLDEIEEKYRVDTRRIYVTGLSMGGFGTWALAVTYPRRFAAIVPICGGGFSWIVARIQHLPVWVFHGKKDTIVELRESEEMVNALKQCGSPVKFTVYPDAGHDSWTATYANPQSWPAAQTETTGRPVMKRRLQRVAVVWRISVRRRLGRPTS